jgi:ABC-2 type transport system permease protein
MVLTIIAILFLHLLGSFGVEILRLYRIHCRGGFCFSAYGIFPGFSLPQSGKRQNSCVAFYLPHLLPSALSDFSQQLTAVAPLLPSYQFYEPLKSILLEDGRIANMSLSGSIYFSGSFTFIFPIY